MLASNDEESCTAENYYLSDDLERQIGVFVDYYNNQHYHESLNNVTPADVYFGRDKAILKQRKRITSHIIKHRACNIKNKQRN